MKDLLAKLETLVDEAIGLLREERQRRALKFMATPPGVPMPTVNPEPWVPVPRHPDLGPDITWQDPSTCAPPPFVGSTITICEAQPNAALYGNH